MKKLILSTMLMIFLCSGTAFASEKETAINLEKKYDNCIFTIEYADEKCNSIVVSPDGVEYLCSTNEEDNTQTCEIESPVEGEYIIKTTNDYVDEIGAIKVKVKTNIVEAEGETGEVTVKKDIDSLKMYFVDNVFHCEWSDKSIKDATVNVSDAFTNKVLGEQTDASSMECVIPDTTTDLMVSVSPSKTNTIEGTTKKYHIIVPSRPLVDITFPNFALTNQTAIDILASSEKYDKEILVNGDCRYNGKDKECSIEIDEGLNEILVYVIDENGNKFSSAYNVVRDTVCPKLSLEKDYNGTSTYEDTLFIRGNVSDFDKLYVNETELTNAVTTDGTFESNVTLHLGTNNIEVKAIDEAGNETLYKISIAMVEKEVNYTPMISFVVLIVLVALFFIFRKRIFEKREKTDKVAPKREKTEVVSKQKRKPANEENAPFFDDKTKKLTIICVVFIILMFGAKSFINFGYITSGSMEPTLMTGSIEFSRRYDNAKDYKRGTIVTLKKGAVPECGDVYLGKRIVGIAGDEITFKNGYVYINGERYVEDYIPDEFETNCQKTFNVPEGCVFVMGDNREASFDARYWENPYVSVNDIKWTHIYMF